MMAPTSIGGPKAPELPKTTSFDNVEFMTATISGASKVDAAMAAKVTADLAALAGKSGGDATVAGTALANSIKAAGVAAFAECGVVETLAKMVADRTTAEPALVAITCIADIVGVRAEPFILPFLPNILSAVSDKKSKELREAAAAAGPAVIKIANPHAVKNVQPFLFAGIAETNWQTKLLSLQLLGMFAERSNVPFSRTLYQVVPVVSAAMWDTKKEVKDAATAATTLALNTCQVFTACLLVLLIFARPHRFLLEHVLVFLLEHAHARTAQPIVRPSTDPSLSTPCRTATSGPSSRT